MTRTKSCELCGFSEFKAISKSDMQQCLSCSIQYPDFVPPTGIVTNQNPVSPTGRGSFLARSQAKMVQGIYNNRRIVDIGCGNGAFLYAFKDLEPNAQKVIGVELDEESRLAAIGAGISVSEEIPNDIRDALVSMWHVAEHISVDEFRQLLAQLSHDDNSLLISVPNGNSYSWIKFGKNFSFYDSKSHLVQYTPGSLKKILMDTGWIIEKEFRTPIYGIFNAIQTGINLSKPHNAMYKSIKRDGNDISASNLLKAIPPIVRAIIPILMMLIYEIKKTRCSSYTVLASAKGS
jgi:hypothetical protein